MKFPDLSRFLHPKKRPENPYADMMSRALAACIDLCVLFILYYDFFYWLDQHYFSQINSNFLHVYQATQDAQVRIELMAQWLSRSVMQLFFFGVAIVGSQIAFGTTPGRWLVGIRIVRAKTHAHVAAWRYVLRYLAYIPACGLLMLGMFWIGFNKERRGWHDYIAGTAVLNLRPHGWYWNHLKRVISWMRNYLASMK